MSSTQRPRHQLPEKSSDEKRAERTAAAKQAPFYLFITFVLTYGTMQPRYANAVDPLAEPAGTAA